MKKLITILLVFVATITASAQYSNNTAYDFYNDDFDWRWDIRVRITEGLNNGLITRWESNRLYKRLERVERKEYAYVNDGVYENWEQEDVWNDVQWLHRQVGIELRDNDRIFYGYTLPGVVFYGYPNWWYRGGYSFSRFDRLGYGSIRYGYAAQCYAPRFYDRNNSFAQRYPYRQRNVYYDNRSNHGNRNINRNREEDTNSPSRTYGPRSPGRSTDVYNGNSRGAAPSVGITSEDRISDRLVRTPQTSMPSSRSYDRSNTLSTNRRSTAPSSVLPERSSSRGNGTTLDRSSTPQRSVAPTMRSPQTRTSSRSESFNRSRSSTPQRSAATSVETRTTQSRASSSSRGNTSGRTKLPESNRSSSRRGN